jgi:imidazolonepropionase-like amidohydrolase
VTNRMPNGMTNRMTLLVGALAALLLAPARTARAQSPRAGKDGAPPAPITTIAITGGRVVTVDGPDIASGTVLIQGGKISAVGKDLRVPQGSRVIDARGAVVYPGLIDGLTTLGLSEVSGVAATVDVAEVGEINPHAKAWMALNPHSDLIPVDRVSGVTAALTAPRGGLISGQSALIRLTGTTPAALTVRAPIALHMNYPSGRPVRDDRPSDADDRNRQGDERTFADRQREKVRNQNLELRRLGHLFEEARAYAAARAAAKAGKIPPPRADLPMESMIEAASGAIPIVLRADDADDIKGAVKFAADRKLKLIIAGGLEAWRVADVLKKNSVAVLLTVDRLPRAQSDPYDAAYANAAKLHAAGVRFAIVSDSDSKARNLPYEAAMARAYGLPAEVALRAITLTPAEILGVADRLGSLSEGKDANVVVASGDIMDHRTGIKHVFIDGVEQPLSSRHTRLYEEFKDRVIDSQQQQ